jgi:peptidoglycan/LPS O-acetylase OafA/YrhL
VPTNPAIYTSSRESSERVFGLDLLRAVAVLLVLRGHGNAHLLRPQGVGFFDVVVWPDGVDLFFVLSGFLIGGILIRRFEGGLVSLGGLLGFWKFRWFRTLPNYFLVLFLSLLLAVWLDGTNYGFGPSYLFFLQNLAWPHPDFFRVAWSLSVEEWFYLSFPLGIWLISSLFSSSPFQRRVLVALSVFMMVGVAARVIVLLRLASEAGWNGLVEWEWRDAHFRGIVVYRLDAIPVGVLGAYLSHWHAGFWRRMRLPGLVLGILLLILHMQIKTKPVALPFALLYRYELLFATLCLLPMLSGWKRATGWLSRPVTFVSLISYSMYLLHHDIVLMITVRTFRGCDGKGWAVFSFLLYVVVSFLLSHLLYRYFERPTTDLRNRSFTGLSRLRRE